MKIHVATNYKERTVKATTDRLSLVVDHDDHFHTFNTTADEKCRKDVSERFWATYDAMKFVEHGMGFHITIDFGSHFYETGMQSPDIGIVTAAASNGRH